MNKTKKTAVHFFPSSMSCFLVFKGNGGGLGGGDVQKRRVEGGTVETTE